MAGLNLTDLIWVVARWGKSGISFSLLIIYPKIRSEIPSDTEIWPRALARQTIFESPSRVIPKIYQASTTVTTRCDQENPSPSLSHFLNAFLSPYQAVLSGASYTSRQPPSSFAYTTLLVIPLNAHLLASSRFPSAQCILHNDCTTRVNTSRMTLFGLHRLPYLFIYANDVTI